MEKPLSIAAIKAILNEINQPLDERISIFRLDQRKGVSVALKSWGKRLEKQREKERKLKVMLENEELIWANGLSWIAGIDEVGRGPLAGPVVAAAVILPKDFQILGINDSKQLSSEKREQLFIEIQKHALGIGIGVKDQDIIDDVNIYQATKLAMLEAIQHLPQVPEYLLIDAMRLPTPIPQESLIKGDSKSLSIAAASIVAKVTRDRMMVEYDRLYPGYGFAQNSGYGTKLHLAGLEKIGVCPIHRHSFAPVRQTLNNSF
ncbi:RNase HII [Carnobacterium iners]|uniref:Ribonuclease HII n=1 Tax=Carnobacterium iners TaxID=1073423 RepID=A0A1X7NF35_9LACT|nr:ribonuclease HII [Carnobacterium iners]SEK37878.1 RNase HII [Carnobacterium iners]SMH35935.1 RNase HII [Carnobacterium iners]